MGPETEYALVPLTKQQFSVIDLLDCGLIFAHKWQAYFDKKTKSFYARTCVPDKTKNRRQKTIGMHRMVMGLPTFALVDHRDRNTLDNRRRNLRLASHSDNTLNSKTRADSQSGLKGVHQDKRWSGKYRARITVCGKRISLGEFRTAEEAKAAWDKAAQEHYGEFMRTQ